MHTVVAPDKSLSTTLVLFLLSDSKKVHATVVYSKPKLVLRDNEDLQARDRCTRPCAHCPGTIPAVDTYRTGTWYNMLMHVIKIHVSVQPPRKKVLRPHLVPGRFFPLALRKIQASGHTEASPPDLRRTLALDAGPGYSQDVARGVEVSEKTREIVV
jgi:hypothetical protein